MNRIEIRFPIFSSCLLLFFIFAVPTVEGQSIGKKTASRLTQAKRKAASVTTAKTTYQKIWDNQPAENWMTDAYPIGNGRIGGMTFGGVNSEHIQFNDNTLWTGNETERGTYQAFGDLFIDFDQTSDHPENYHRELDLSRSLSTISYSANQTQFKREYFCSFPDQVMVLRYTADKKGAFSASLRLKMHMVRNQLQMVPWYS
ncbi:hypothetical protein PBAL39_22405 [Pedobacter sp. BAL39]|uniref:glycoside hydrolase family 95 protein n=1 Tax=Pedobacter sp. BAL39 TaxID=391596 RepID=UPI00015596AE|nr:glycoside hydrolase family 95 protein [Pedobacter sp. BAL39]EDM38872.1 hypothetical protein PBAL39_22405 [Pedobacter sp. BAL39]